MEGKLSESIWAFQGAVQADGSSATAFFGLGNAYFQRAYVDRDATGAPKTQDLRQAMEAYQTALALDPRLSALPQPFALYQRLAECYRALGRLEMAATTLKQGAAAAKHNPLPFLYAAELRYQMRDYAKSAENLQSGLLRARRLGQYPAVAKLVRTDPRLSTVLNAPQNRAVLELYDQVQAGTRAESQARASLGEMSSLRDAPASTPRPRRSFLDKMRLGAPIEVRLEAADQLFKFNQYQEAADAYRKVLDADKGKGLLDSQRLALIYENLGVCYHHLGRVDEAVDALERSDAVMPYDAGVHYRLALAQSSAGRYPEALSALESAFKNVRNMSDLRVFLLLSKTDAELTPLRDMPGFRNILEPYEAQLRSGD